MIMCAESTVASFLRLLAREVLALGAEADVIVAEGNHPPRRQVALEHRPLFIDDRDGASPIVGGGHNLGKPTAAAASADELYQPNIMGRLAPGGGYWGQWARRDSRVAFSRRTAAREELAA
jgi:hypothetical protein